MSRVKSIVRMPLIHVSSIQHNLCVGIRLDKLRDEGYAGEVRNSLHRQYTVVNIIISGYAS